MTPEQLKLYRNAHKGFVNELGFELTEVQEGYAKGELTITWAHRNPIKSVHGGVLFSIADTVGGVAATSRGRACTTVSGSIHYLRPALNCEKLIAETREIKVGKNMAVYEVLITDESGTELALVTMTYYFMGRAEDYMEAFAEYTKDTEPDSSKEHKTEKR